MNTEAEHFHKLYGLKRQRITYQPKDALDYALMIVITGAVIWFTFGASSVIAAVGLALCAFMLISFAIRHGVELRKPVILDRPQDVLYSLIYKLQNIKAPYLWALGLLLLEQYVIYLTPQWPHHVAWMNQAALYLFYGHFAVLTLYRTAILVSHLHKKELVREILMQSIWKQRLERQPSIVWEIVHAWCTGMLTHIVLLAPWYLVITHADFSLVLLPITLIAGAVLSIRFADVINEWFYRDHWVGHNSELDFIYLHGTHHDAIPSGLIGVAGNGYLEGFLRGAIAFPTPFLNPLVAALYYTVEVKSDIELHQYIPGVFPKLPREIFEIAQHSVHHFGRVEPYSFGVNLNQPHVSDEIKKQFKLFPEGLKQSIALDQRLDGYQWDNARYRWFMDLVDRYHDANERQEQRVHDSVGAAAPREAE